MPEIPGGLLADLHPQPHGADSQPNPNQGLAFALPLKYIFSYGNSPGYCGLHCPCSVSRSGSARGVEGATTWLWVATLVDLHRVGVDRFCDCLIRCIPGARRGFVIANAGNLLRGPSGDGGPSPPLLGGQAGHIENRVSALEIFHPSFTCLRYSSRNITTVAGAYPA
jgi:hypothetical protein